MLIEVYFEPIELGQIWCVIGGVITLIPFSVAQLIRKKLRRKKLLLSQ